MSINCIRDKLVQSLMSVKLLIKIPSVKQKYTTTLQLLLLLSFNDNPGKTVPA